MNRTLFAVAALCLSHAAVAGDFYVEAAAGISSYDDVADTDFSGEPGVDRPLSGVAFDSNETTWGLNVGWQAKSWLAIEFGYQDLGNSGSFDPSAPAYGVAEGTAEIPVSLPDSVFVQNASIATEQWRLGAKFTVPLGDDFSAHWYTGVARSNFEASGTSTSFIYDPGPPASFTNLPYSTPGSETGFSLGAGLGWKVNDRFELDLSYRRHQTGVIDVDAITLGLTTKIPQTKRK